MKIELSDSEKKYVLNEVENYVRNADDGRHEIDVKIDIEDDVYVTVDVEIETVMERHGYDYPPTVRRMWVTARGAIVFVRDYEIELNDEELLYKIELLSQP